MTTASGKSVPDGSRRSKPWLFGAPGRDPVENGRAGGLKSGEIRREQGKSVRERLREQVEADFERIWAAFDAGLSSDDERTQLATAVAVLAEAYGKPPQALVGDPEKPVSFVLESAFSRTLNVPDEYPPALEAADQNTSRRMDAPALGLRAPNEEEGEAT